MVLGQVSSASRCFSGDSFVRTVDNQRKQMKNLQVGDEVLTMTSVGKPTFSKVTMFMHRNPNMFVEDFVKITTFDGKEITLSGYHMIYTNEEKYIFAKNVQLNQTVMVYDQIKHVFHPSVVQNVTFGSDVGVFAPLTDEGTIIVDDVFASCYALFPSHEVSHGVFWLWRKLLFPFFGQSIESNEEYHWYPNLFRKSLNYFGVLSYSL